MKTYWLTIENYLLLLLWSVWWGGLTFYAAVVVPIGTEILGSMDQGFITRRVTLWHNAVSVVFLFVLLLVTIRRRSRGLGIITAVMSLPTVALILWHSRLSGLMDFVHQIVARHFYTEHAVYLWITVVEWGFGMLMPIWLFQRNVWPSHPVTGRFDSNIEVPNNER